jgi:hypothetical protein
VPQSAISSPVSAVSVRVTAPLYARVDQAGRLSLAASGEQATIDCDLRLVNGQWRIDALPDVLMVSQADFDFTYHPVPIYFCDPGGKWLVPEVRWFSAGAVMPTAVVKAVLAGPSSWLTGSVVTGAPAGTEMTLPVVPVQNGLAVVDLNSQMLTADTWHRRLLLAQLRASIATLRGLYQLDISDLVIRVNSRTFNPGNANLAGDSTPRLLAEAEFDGRPVGYSGGRLVRVQGDQLQTVNGVDELDRPGASHPAVAPGGTSYAALRGSDQLWLASPGQPARLLVSGRGPLSPPSVDLAGLVWTSANSGQGSVILAGNASRPVAALATHGWPNNLRVIRLRPSGDGTRVLIGATLGTERQLLIAGVLRDQAGLPVGLGPPQLVVGDFTEIYDLAWVGESQVVVLGPRVGQPSEPWLVRLGGAVTATAAMPAARRVLAVNGEILIGGADPPLRRLAGSTWVRAADVSWPAMPG